MSSKLPIDVSERVPSGLNLFVTSLNSFERGGTRRSSGDGEAGRMQRSKVVTSLIRDQTRRHAGFRSARLRNNERHVARFFCLFRNIPPRAEPPCRRPSPQTNQLITQRASKRPASLSTHVSSESDVRMRARAKENSAEVVDEIQMDKSTLFESCALLIFHRDSTRRAMITPNASY